MQVFREQGLFLNRFAHYPGVLLGLGDAEFIRAEEPELRQSAFLDGRELLRPVELQLSLEEFSRQADQANPSHAFGLIYHSAFCCSTYLARCLDATGIGHSLKEPYALTQISFYLADETFQQFESADEWNRFLRSALNFLSRPGESGQFPLIKTHNFSVVLAGDIARLYPGRARSVFIYSDLRSFLISTLKSPERREFVRLLLKLLSPAKAARLGLPGLDPSGLVDPEAAALCWLMHMAYYETAARQSLPGAFCSLNCERLLEQPVETLLALAAYFGQPADRIRIEAGLNDPAVKSHAKNPQRAFNANLRRTELQTQGFLVRQEVRDALRWFDGLDLSEGLRAPPLFPLTGG